MTPNCNSGKSSFILILQFDHWLSTKIPLLYLRIVTQILQTIDWTSIEKETYPGETGSANWQSIQFGGIRVRLVEYSKDYCADHWCQKGHIVHCLEGEFITELESGEKIRLSKGETYIVSDDCSSHRSCSAFGVKLLIIDGDFLK